MSLALWETFWDWGGTAASVGVYFDFSAGVNGSGTSASPYNTFSTTTAIPGRTYFFRRGTTCDITNFQLVAGNSLSSLVTYSAYYNADGTDDITKARPIINSTVAFSTYASPKDYLSINHWDIRAPALAIGNDKSVIFLGNGCTINDCSVDSNVGCLGVYGKSNVIITNNTFIGVSHDTANNNNVLIVSDAFTMDSILIEGNTILHYGGGSTTSLSNAMRLESTVAGGLNNLVVRSNTVRPANACQRMLPGFGFINETESMRQGQLPSLGYLNTSPLNYCRNKGAIGMRIARTPSALVTLNTVQGMLEGIWLNGGGTNTAATFTYNTCNYNMHFGLHFTTRAIGCTIEHNICSYNGININSGPLLAYGRGIEFSSAAGQGMCANHTIRYNTCNYNMNYGGPSDNASEGVGIGLDDGTSGCLVTGNTIRFNEGNGVQYYGGTLGSGSPPLTNTSNNVIANFFESNGSAAIKNRRTSGTYNTTFTTHIGVANTIGATTYIANNVILGGTCGIRQNASCLLVNIANNIFIDVPHAISFDNTPALCFNNDFHSDTVAIQKYSLGTQDLNGEPTFPDAAFAGIADGSFDPLLNASYIPQDHSQALDSGHYIGAFNDFLGNLFNNPPDLGMYEVTFPLPPLPPTQNPDALARGAGGGGHKREFEYEPLSDEYWEEREARFLRDSTPAPILDEVGSFDLKVEPPTLVIDQQIAAAIESAQSEIASLKANLLNVNSVQELMTGAARLRELDSSLPDLKAKLYKWMPAKFTTQ